MGVRLFCVDGSNLVRTAYGHHGAAHADAQENQDSARVMQVFAGLCREVGGGVEVELFFDGASRDLGEGGPDNLSVVFTWEAAADTLILDRVRTRVWRGGGTVTVVTADVELGQLAESEGGKWLRVGVDSTPEGVARRIGGRFAR